MRAGRPRFPVGIGVGAALLIGAAADDASAAALGGVATSLGLLAALSILLLKAWQGHLLLGSLSTFFGMLALVTGIALLCRRRSAPGLGSSVVEPPTPTPIALPSGVDRQTLLNDLRRHFLELQKAWDNNAREQLLGMTTSEMLEELCAARAVGCGMANHTEVLTLDAHLVAFEQLGAAQVVCVEFSGMIRESVPLADAPFRELWMLTRANNAESGWRLARHQAML